MGLFEVVDIGVSASRLDYAVDRNPWTFEEVGVTVLEPLAKFPDGPGDRRGGRTETSLKTASSLWRALSPPLPTRLSS